MINSFIIDIDMMLDRENKISKGLDKLLNSKKSNQFPNHQDVFIGDPAVRNSYFESFYQAQLAEIAYTEAKY
ncbi:MAG: hypothetical protein CMP48_06825 [Rickettsiales bacterium]|nr:hypothetical protein [Rickettsiales bacterium]|tara:strand:+ start:498 stop:713 length:216 start_codon:yes stop_codon:yes gene_type:complete